MYYSPVCHFTHVLLHSLVRLACIRHAASVRSEPGSNSSVKLNEFNLRYKPLLNELIWPAYALLLFSYQRPGSSGNSDIYWPPKKLSTKNFSHFDNLECLWKDGFAAESKPS